MVPFIVAGCGACAVFYVWTWNPVYLVPLLTGVLFLAARAVEKRLQSAGRRGGPEFDRKVKEWQFRTFPIVMGTIALVLAADSFFTNGWTPSGVLLGACSLYFLGLWACRKARRQTPPPGRGVEPRGEAGRPRE
jgi:hypothetical protein